MRAVKRDGPPVVDPAQKKGGSLAALRENRFFLPLLVLALAALVYGTYGFGQVLLRDYSIYLYSGQRVAEGVPPYVGVFDHKGPMSPMIAGLGVMLSAPLGLDDVLAVRLVFYATGCLSAVAVYLLGACVFRSRTAGLFGALTFLGFYAYAQAAASGPEPKTPMVLFETLNLLFASRKRWFWSGLFGSLAFLVWQPMVIFPFVTFVLAVVQPGRERYGAALRALAGVFAPILAVLAYFWYHGALYDLLNGFVLFNAEHLVRGDTPVWSVLGTAAVNIALPYGTMLVPIVIGLAMIVRLYFVRPFRYRFAPILLSFPVPVLFSMKDFQLADDFYPFLPYAAVGFGAFLTLVIHRPGGSRLLAALASAALISAPVLWSLKDLRPADGPYVLSFAILVLCASLALVILRIKEARFLAAFLCVILLGVAFANTLDEVNAQAAYRLKGTDVSLSEQREGAQEVEDRFGEDAKIVSINSPQILVLLHRVDPDPYLWITAGVDRDIDARTPGGFEGWVQKMEALDPDLVTFFGEGQSLMPSSQLSEEHNQELFDWIRPNYHAEKIGPWWLFVKNT